MKSSFSKFATAAALLSGIFGVAGCAHHKQPEPMNTISVTATSREPVAFSPNAVAYVRLADVTQGQARSTTNDDVAAIVKEHSDVFAAGFGGDQLNPWISSCVSVVVMDASCW